MVRLNDKARENLLKRIDNGLADIESFQKALQDIREKVDEGQGEVNVESIIRTDTYNLYTQARNMEGFCHMLTNDFRNVLLGVY